MNLHPHEPFCSSYSIQYTSSIVSFIPPSYEIYNGLVRCPQHSPTSCHNTASTAAVKVKVVFKDSQIRVSVLLRTLASSLGGVRPSPVARVRLQVRFAFSFRFKTAEKCQFRDFLPPSRRVAAVVVVGVRTDFRSTILNYRVRPSGACH